MYSPANQSHVNQTPANQTPANQTPVNQTPVNQTPANQTPANQTHANQTPFDKQSDKYKNNIDGKREVDFDNVFNESNDLDEPKENMFSIQGHTTCIGETESSINMIIDYLDISIDDQ